MVQSYAFYLLSEGGSGTNEAGITYSVNGIGIQAAGKIAMSALINYLSSDATFLDSANAWLWALCDEYNYGNGMDTSTFVNTGFAICDAWNAVGVYPWVVCRDYNLYVTFY